MAVELHAPRLRRPSTVAVLGVATLGLYLIVWYYRINRDMRDFGAEHDDRGLGATKPWVSAIAMSLGGVIVVPRLISLLRTVGRVQTVERIATRAARPAIGLRVGLTAAAILPLGSSAHRVGGLFAALGAVALIASATRVQARLNHAWRQPLAAPSQLGPRVLGPPQTIGAGPATAMPPSRSIQDLLERADQQRRDRIEREQAR